METLVTTPITTPAKNPLPYKKILLFGAVFLAAILPVIFFVSSLKSTDADISRIAHLSLTKERIDDAMRRGINIPLPTNALELSYGDIKMGYQGRAGKDLFLALGIEFLKDPETGEMYHYFIRPDTKEYELIALLNDSQYANYKVGEKAAYSLGSSRGHMLVMNSGKNKGELVSSILKNAQKVDLGNEAKREQIGWKAQKSCKEILEKQPDASSGKYVIEIGGKLLTVYCDMKTAGGGWTLFYANNGHPGSEIKMSYREMRDEMESAPAPQLHEYDNPNLAGLVNYNHFIDMGAAEIMIRNRTGDPTKWVKFLFSTSSTLSWALGDRVLGKTNKGCTDIPGGGTWSIINQDGKIRYDNLTSIMTNKGTSWGVSHENHWCNDFIGNANPHIGFYSASDNQDGGRTRGTDGVGGAWGGENEYRYFIR
ncbi:hypothetical protein KA071_00885 [Candidatus Gracilibacteria bacterium]|nr:hypothetical protein [Candidatus Gracilibacteria bacterium]